jgi:hypothetical protein
MRPDKLAIVKKIKNQSWVDISLNDLYELDKLDFTVERGTKHHVVFHARLVNHPRFSNGNIVIGAHKKDKERVDYNGAQDLKQAFKYLGYL